VCDGAPLKLWENRSDTDRSSIPVLSLPFFCKFSCAPRMNLPVSAAVFCILLAVLLPETTYARPSWLFRYESHPTSDPKDSRNPIGSSRAAPFHCDCVRFENVPSSLRRSLPVFRSSGLESNIQTINRT